MSVPGISGPGPTSDSSLLGQCCLDVNAGIQLGIDMPVPGPDGLYYDFPSGSGPQIMFSVQLFMCPSVPIGVANVVGYQLERDSFIPGWDTAGGVGLGANNPTNAIGQGIQQSILPGGG